MNTDETLPDATPVTGGAAPSRTLEPKEVAEALPSARFGKFVRTEKLGAGGMGEVWKAWDTELNRWVALKFVRDEAIGDLEAFRREAVLAGRLDHPNIAAIYEVGEDRGAPYIAMQYVDGRTLKQLEGRDARRAASLVRDAARALHFAHAAGVVHRDLKPANLMVDRTGRLFVMDFGLARSVDAEKSASGSVVGTPAYMAPEQARGERVDGRADVYGLGATLYELLTGRRPIEGSTVFELLHRVQKETPRSPRAIEPGVDVDLETVVMKCLEKERERRYATAEELGEDLGRWLEGRPIAARPVSAVTRIAYAIRARKPLVVTTAVAVLVTIGVAALMAAGVMRSGRAARTSEQTMVAEMRRTSETCLAAALDLRRAGDLAGMRRQLDQVERTCRDVIRERPGEAEPHYRLGRMHRAVMDDPAALAEQNEALRKDPSYGQALFERAMLTARAYRARVRDLVREAWSEKGRRLSTAGGGEVRPGQAVEAPDTEEIAARDPEASALADAMRRDLDRLSASVPPEELATARAVAAWCRGDAAEVERCLNGLAVLGEYAVEALAGGDPDRAMRVLGDAIEKDRGYLPYRERRAEALLECAQRQACRGEDPERLFAEAVSELDGVVGLDATRREALILRGGVRSLWATHARGHGGDPDAMYERAMADYRLALAKDESLGEAWLGLGAAASAWAAHRIERGQEPSDLFDMAGAALVRAKRLMPRRAEVPTDLGKLEVNRGQFDARHGKDPTERYRASVAAYMEALTLDPSSAATWMRLGKARTAWGKFEMEHGIDPAARFESAIADLGEAIGRDASLDEAWSCRGIARMNWGNDCYQRRKDPCEHYAAAILDFGEALKRNPGRDDNWLWRGNTHGNRGMVLMARHDDPVPDYEQAVADFSESLKVNPKRAETWQSRGLVHINRASWIQFKGGDVTESYERAVADLREAAALNPKDYENWLRMANAHLNWGANSSKAGGNPDALYAACIEDCRRALELNPSSADTYKMRGSARNNIAKRKRSRGGDAKAEFTAALEDFTKAVALNGKLAGAVRSQMEDCRAGLRGTPAWLETLRQAHRLQRGGDLEAAAAAYAKGFGAIAESREAWREALGVRTTCLEVAVAHYNYGCCLARRGEKKPALAELGVAADLGFTDGGLLGRDGDLESIRGETGWDELVERVARPPVLGVSMEDAPEGVKVIAVTTGGPAERGAIAGGDIIVECGGVETFNTIALSYAVRRAKGGSKVVVAVLRGGERREIEVTLGRRP